MALRKIVEIGEDCLNKVCRPVTEFNPHLHVLLDDMAETLADANGAGLAAPQVGVLRRAVVIDIGDEHGLIELINPVITFREGEQKGEEGCLSCGSRRGVVTRPMKVTVVAKNRKGMEVTYDAEGLLARAMCHEIDHLDGHLFIDVMEEELFDDDEEVLDGEIADDEE